MALIGLSGGMYRTVHTGGLASRLHLVRPDKRRSYFTGLRFLTMGLFGLGLTLIYDFLTNLATAYVMGQFWPVMIAAIPFALLHILSNVAIFVILTPVLLKFSRMLTA